MLLLLLCIIIIGAIATSGNDIEGVWPIYVIDINCTGLEQTLMECPFNNLIGTHACNQIQDAFARCQYGVVDPSDCSDGELRLIGRTASNEGQVEVCINQVWGGVCYSSGSHAWGVEESMVACRQLGYLDKGMVYFLIKIEDMKVIVCRNKP